MSCTFDLAHQTYAKMANVLYGDIAQALVTEVPYLSVLPNKGTFPANTAQTLTAVSQGRAVVNDSLVAPTFSNLTDNCGNTGAKVIQTGTTHYEYRPKIMRGTSEKICYAASFESFKGSLLSQYDAIKKKIKVIMNADIRNELITKSGIKAVVRAGVPVHQMISGGENQFEVSFQAVRSNARLNFNLLLKFGKYLREVCQVQPFGSGAGAYLAWIGSDEINEHFREDLGAAASATGFLTYAIAQLQGGDKAMMNSINGYTFITTNRGVNLAKEQQPWRGNWNGAGYTPVEPEIAVESSTGVVASVNPAWLEAEAEIGILMGQGSFDRQTPAGWTGEGQTRFPQQMLGGELKFANYADNCENVWQEFGSLVFRIGRAYKPNKPWFVLPILYKRCNDDAGVAVCSGVSGL